MRGERTWPIHWTRGTRGSSSVPCPTRRCGWRSRHETGPSRRAYAPPVQPKSSLQKESNVTRRGLVISKIVVPNDLAPGMYLTWHGVHDSASTATLVILGL